jgi:adenylate kinase family enzyme
MPLLRATFLNCVPALAVAKCDTLDALMPILLLGAPVAIKNAPAERLERELAFQLVDHTAVVRRALAAVDVSAGDIAAAKDSVAAGRLIPDEVQLRLLSRALSEAADLDRVLLTNYPRSESQAVLLDAWLGVRGTSISLVLWIELAADALQKHLVAMGVDPEIAAIKAETFTQAALPLKAFYAQGPNLRELSGSLSIDALVLAARRTFG